MKAWKVRLMAVAMCCLVVTSCGPGSQEASSHDASVARFNEARGVLEKINFEEHTPRQLLTEATLAVYGTVQSVRDGRTYDPGGLRMRNVVVGLQATDVLKDDEARQGDLIYFEMLRSDDSKIDAIEDALPEGTEVALFAYPANDPGFAVDGDPDAGRQPGSSVYFPMVQGLWIETDSGLACVLDLDIASRNGWTAIEDWSDLANATLAT